MIHRKMNEPWTPGPWAFAMKGRAAGVLGPDDRVIAETWCHVRDGNDSADVDEATANARLIAAAPEMAELLAALAEPIALMFGNQLSRKPSPSPLQIEARALLSHIRGEA